MPYCTQDDVEQEVGGAERLIQLTDWDKTGTVNVARVDAAIAKADRLIDSFASKRFTVPFSPVPEVIKDVSAELAALFLKRPRGMWGPDEQKRWAELAGTSKGEEGWLQQLATGVVTPGTDPMPTKHSTMVADRVDATLPESRDVSRDRTGGLW